MSGISFSKNVDLASLDLNTKIIADIQHLLDMASFYTEEDNEEVIQIVELTKKLTQALKREPGRTSEGLQVVRS